MSRKKATKSMGTQPKKFDADSDGASLPLKSLVIIASLLALVSLGVYLLTRGNSTKLQTKTNGPRLQADSLDDQKRGASSVYELPINSETVDFDSLKAEMIAQAVHMASFYPKNPAALDLCASVHYDLNRLPEADKYWRACMELQPTDPEYFVSYAQFLNGQERPDEAIKILEDAHNRSVETAGTYHQLATAYERSGNIEKAAEISSQINERFPEFGESWLLSGKVQNQLGQFAQAEVCLQKALELKQSEINVWPVLVTVLARQGKRDQATALRDKLKLLQDSSKATDEDGQLQPFQEKFEASLRNRAARLFFLSSIVEKKSWNSDEALRLIQRSLRLKSDDVTALSYLAELLVEQNRAQEALIVYQRLCKLQPENVAHFSSLAGLAYREQNQHLTEQALEAGLKLHPEADELKIPLAKIYMGLNKPLEARVLVEQVLSKSKNPEAMMIRGASLKMTGDTDESNRAYETARLWSLEMEGNKKP